VGREVTVIPKSKPSFTDARKHVAEARSRVDSLLGLPGAHTPEAEILQAIDKVRNLPMHDDVVLVLEVIETYLRSPR
jgi:hypothetical protein